MCGNGYNNSSWFIHITAFTHEFPISYDNCTLVSTWWALHTQLLLLSLTELCNLGYGRLFKNSQENPLRAACYICYFLSICVMGMWWVCVVGRGSSRRARWKVFYLPVYIEPFWRRSSPKLSIMEGLWISMAGTCVSKSRATPIHSSASLNRNNLTYKADRFQAVATSHWASSCG